MATKAHLEGNRNYLAKQDHITIRAKMGQKEYFKAAAEAAGVSLNSYILEAIYEKIERDGKRKEDKN